MKILIDIPFYFPYHCSGGEATMRDIAAYMISKKCEVRILVDKSSVKEYEGIEIFTDDHWTMEQWKPHYEWCDVVISHLGKIGMSYTRAKAVSKPFFYYQHNSNHSATVEAKREIKVIYNSEWIKQDVNYSNESIVCRPISIKQYEKKEKGKYITLINGNENKGITQFIAIARQVPNENFLIVKGDYGKQLVEGLPSNITVWNNTPNMEEVYNATKILLCPSLYESWGRVATEAMSCGIPVICSYAKGLQENCGEKGIYIERNDITKWVAAISEVENNYENFSILSKKRYEEIGNDYDKLFNFIKC